GAPVAARERGGVARARGAGPRECLRRRRDCRHVPARGRGPPCAGRIRRGSSLSTSHRSPSRSPACSRRGRSARRRRSRRSVRTQHDRHVGKAPIVTHESLSATPYRPLPPSTVPYRLFIVDEAHRFRNPITNRYRALARLVVGSRVLLVTATPVHNRIADLFHLFRLFLRDHDLTALGVPSLWRAARGDADRHAVTAAAARLSVSRSREHVQAGYGTGPVVLPFPERAAGESIRVGTAPDAELRQLVTGVAGLEAGGEAAALFRLLLLSQLASSL